MVSRRELLATLPAVALAGCVGRGGSGSPTPADDRTATPAPTDTPTATAPPTLAPDTVLLTVTDGEGEGEVDLLTVGGIAETGAVQESRGGAHVVPVELTETARESFRNTLARVGALDSPEAHEIRTYLDGEVLFTASISPGFAEAVQSGDWDGTFRLAVEEAANARRLRRRLG
jgi:hypothetical protein